MREFNCSRFIRYNCIFCFIICSHTCVCVHVSLFIDNISFSQFTRKAAQNGFQSCVRLLPRAPPPPPQTLPAMPSKAIIITKVNISSKQHWTQRSSSSRRMSWVYWTRLAALNSGYIFPLCVRIFFFHSFQGWIQRYVLYRHKSRAHTYTAHRPNNTARRNS